MTHRLHDVLDDIAADVPSIDLVAGVTSRAALIRWRRRAVVGAAACGVAMIVGLVTVGLPSWQQSTRPDRELPITNPTAPLLAQDIDLDAAPSGSLPTASGLMVVRETDGSLRIVAIDVEDGDAVAIDAAAPDDLEGIQLSHDGSRALLVGGTSAVAIEVATGDTVYEMAREQHQPVALSWDSRSIITFARDMTPDPAGSTTPWQLTTIDLATGVIQQLGAPLQRSSAAGEIFAAPYDGAIFVRYDGSIGDNRLFRLDLATGVTTYSDDFTALDTESMHWSADGALLAAETPSAVRVMTPNDKVGVVIASLTKAGVPLGFAGHDHLVWWRLGTGAASLVLTDLSGNELPDTTTLHTDGTVIAVATAIG
jgi:hypothetical protein